MLIPVIRAHRGQLLAILALLVLALVLHLAGVLHLSGAVMAAGIITDRSRGLREERGQAIATARRILDAAGGREFTAAQERDYAAAIAEAERLGSAIETEEGTAAPDARSARLAELERSVGRGAHRSDPNAGDPMDGGVGGVAPRGRQAAGTAELRSLFLRGRPAALTRAHSFADVVTDPRSEQDAAFRELGAGVFLRALATGDWSGVPAEARSMIAGSDAAGGYLLPQGLSAQLIDRARARTVTLRAGALTMPMPTSDFDVARAAGDVSTEWHTELASLTPTDMTLERVSLHAKTLTASTKVSRELLQDASNVDQAIEDSMSEAIALKLDEVGLRGDGAGKPLGIRNQVGVQVTASAGSPADYIKFAQDPTKLLADVNAEGPFSLITNPRLLHSLSKLNTGIASDLTSLRPPAAWDDLTKYTTTMIPTNLGGGTNESEAYIGDFAQLVYGIRSELRIEVFREIYADQLGVLIVAHLRGDVMLRHPDHFVVVPGILA
jgi:HK97 family phage major capsid protein